MAGNKSKRIVPWISAEEWNQVYQMVYSDDDDDKREALWRITMWKSRVQKLTLGVECTLHLLQAILRDEEFKANPDNLSSNDITLMYSTAIIRFINLISHSGQVDSRHQPISTIAAMVGIPDWLVSIRHEATHAQMPNLGILRPGARLAMDWLKENYWRTEEEASFDLYWPECKKTAAKLIRAKKVEAQNKSSQPVSFDSEQEEIPDDLILVVSMLTKLLKEMSTFQRLSQIKSQSLRDFINLVLKRASSTGDSTVNQKDVDNVHLSLNKIRGLVLAEIHRIMSEWFGADAGEPGKAEEELETAKGKCVVIALCQCPELLEGSAQFSHLTPIWKLVQQWHSVPYLMDMLSSKLTGNAIQRSAVLLCLSELCDSFINDRDKRSSALKFTPAVRNHNWNRTIRNILQHPDRRTWTLVSKIFSLQNPPTPFKTQKKISKLLHVYLNEEQPDVSSSTDVVPGEDVVYTLESLVPIKDTTEKSLPIFKIQAPERHEIPNSSNKSIEAWTPCTDIDWSKVAIGSLPHTILGPEELDLTEVEWVRVEREYQNKDPTGRGDHKRMGDRFDWNTLSRKRRRRGGQNKEIIMTL